MRNEKNSDFHVSHIEYYRHNAFCMNVMAGNDLRVIWKL